MAQFRRATGLRERKKLMHEVIHEGPETVSSGGIS